MDESSACCCRRSYIAGQRHLASESCRSQLLHGVLATDDDISSILCPAVGSDLDRQCQEVSH